MIEEIHWIQRSQQGDKVALETVMNAYMYLVPQIARQFYLSQNDGEDIRQMGCIGLVKAIYRFEIKHNVPFSTYAAMMIRFEMVSFFRSNTMIRRSRMFAQLTRKKTKVNDIFIQRFERYATNAELGLLLDCDEVLLQQLEQQATSICQFDALDTQVADSVSFSQSLQLQLALKQLPKIVRQIIELRYLADLTQQQTSNCLEMSQSTISKLEKKGLNLLRQLV